MSWDRGDRRPDCKRYVPSPGRFRINKVVWRGSVNVADTYAITDRAATNPSTIAEGIAATGSVGLPQINNCNREVNDLQVTQISSGTVLIYLAPLA